MVAVDLNADLAEGEALSPGDLAVLAEVTSASLACGFHAGNRRVMADTAAAAMARGVVIGAHVSYRDREGFGRRPLPVAAARLVGDIDEQCTVLDEVVGALGGVVAYVKPHGALYNRMGTDPDVAAAVVEALVGHGHRVLVAQAGTVVVDVARKAGLQVVPEAFPDRGYRPDGSLTPRERPGSVVDDPDLVAARAVSLVAGGIEATDRTWVAVPTATLCIHGDSPHAAGTAAAVRSALAAAGVDVKPFLTGPVTGPVRPSPR
jgi:UPF0271 protein